MAEERRFVIWAQDYSLYWGPNRGGYTSNLARAGRYTREEADSIAKVRGTDIPQEAPLPCAACGGSGLEAEGAVGNGR